jgi:hypothetical protein
MVGGVVSCAVGHESEAAWGRADRGRGRSELESGDAEAAWNEPALAGLQAGFSRWAGFSRV